MWKYDYENVPFIVRWFFFKLPSYCELESCSLFVVPTPFQVSQNGVQNGKKYNRREGVVSSEGEESGEVYEMGGSSVEIIVGEADHIDFCCSCTQGHQEKPREALHFLISVL